MERLAVVPAAPGAPLEFGTSLQLVPLAPATAQPASLSDAEINAKAASLAREMRCNVVEAVDRNVGWYRDQLGRDACTYSDAAVLRLQTMYACREMTTARLAREAGRGVSVGFSRRTGELLGPPEIVTYPQPEDEASAWNFGMVRHRVTTGLDTAYRPLSGAQALRTLVWSSAIALFLTALAYGLLAGGL